MNRVLRHCSVPQLAELAVLDASFGQGQATAAMRNDIAQQLQGFRRGILKQPNPEVRYRPTAVNSRWTPTYRRRAAANRIFGIEQDIRNPPENLQIAAQRFVGAEATEHITAHKALATHLKYSEAILLTTGLWSVGMAFGSGCLLLSAGLLQWGGSLIASSVTFGAALAGYAHLSYPAIYSTVIDAGTYARRHTRQYKRITADSKSWSYSGTNLALLEPAQDYSQHTSAEMWQLRGLRSAQGPIARAYMMSKATFGTLLLDHLWHWNAERKAPQLTVVARVYDGNPPQEESALSHLLGTIRLGLADRSHNK